ncbi:MAG: hypothetical protein ACKVS9_15505 [Phycisphaerae bacterium]
MRPDDLLAKLNDLPFRPFRIHLSDGSVFNVVQPGMVMVGIATAVLPRQFVKLPDGTEIADTWRTISLKHIVQLSDVDEKRNGHRRRKR